MSLGTALYTSILIGARLALEYFKNLNTDPGRKGDQLRYYTRAFLIVVPVESAAIYTINLLVFVILTAQRKGTLSYPQNIHPQLAVCHLLTEFAVRTDQMRPGYCCDPDIPTQCPGLLKK